MSALIFLVPIALGLGATFAMLFVIAARNGQFDDLDDPPLRMLRDVPERTRPVCEPPQGPDPSH